MTWLATPWDLSIYVAQAPQVFSKSLQKLCHCADSFLSLSSKCFPCAVRFNSHNSQLSSVVQGHILPVHDYCFCQRTPDEVFHQHSTMLCRCGKLPVVEMLPGVVAVPGSDLDILASSEYIVSCSLAKAWRPTEQCILKIYATSTDYYYKKIWLARVVYLGPGSDTENSCYSTDRLKRQSTQHRNKSGGSL